MSNGWPRSAAWQASARGLPSARDMRLLGHALLGWAAMLGLAFAAAGLVGCTPHVGDHCNQNSDCSLQGTLQCDTSQPNGYCTLFSCTGNSCQNNAVCVALNASVPGCP